mmetsp:Transcript_22997/g.54664  ORF Transcript_22997/g.54664 Transcript_22997/m.54664 type:complete len:157 (+) Transcript_22997:320-790(+)
MSLLVALLSSPDASSSLCRLQEEGLNTLPAMDCIRGCTRLAGRIAGEVRGRLARMESSIALRSARTLERRQFVALLYETPSLLLALLLVVSVIDTQAISADLGLFALFTKMIVFLDSTLALVDKAQYGDAVKRAATFFSAKLFRSLLNRPLPPPAR